MISISSNLNLMIKAAEKASKSVIRDFGELEKLQVSKKGPRDFVTKTDKKVEKILIDELSKAKKNYSFLSEEIGTIKNKDEATINKLDDIINDDNDVSIPLTLELINKNCDNPILITRDLENTKLILNTNVDSTSSSNLFDK